MRESERFPPLLRCNRIPHFHETKLLEVLRVGRGKFVDAESAEAEGIDEELRLPDTDYTVSFWFKTTADNIRLCAATRYSSYASASRGDMLVRASSIGK